MFARLWDLFVRLRKPLLNDDYAAQRSICAFSAVEGVWAVRADRVVLEQAHIASREGGVLHAPPHP